MTTCAASPSPSPAALGITAPAPGTRRRASARAAPRGRGATSARPATLALGLTLLAAALSLLLFDRPLVRGDGLAYYMWLRPIATEHSFDLNSSAAQFAGVNEYQVFRYGPTGRWATAFSFGPAVLLAPFYLLGGTLPEPDTVDTSYYLRWQSEPFARSFTVLLGANLLVLAAVALSWDAARRLGASGRVAGVAALALLWGTPLLYYGSVEAFMAHGPGAFALALAVWLAVRPKPRWGLVGLALSVASLVRWQLALTVLPFAVLLLLRRDWGGLVRLGLGAAALAWLVPLSWWWMYGTFSSVPAAEQNMRPFLTGPVYLFDVALSPERGWLVWSPLAGLGCLGLVLLARRRPAVAWPLLAAVALQLLMNASVTEWQAGWSFGMRRMADLYPIYTVGLAGLLGSTSGALRRVAWGAAAAATLWAALLFVAHLSYINAVNGAGGPALTELAHLLGDRTGPRIALDAIAGHYGPWAWARPGP